MKILLIEDHKAMQELVASHLRDRGFVVDNARLGGEALSMAVEREYDAVVLDLGLPDIDGMDLLRRLQSELPAPVPVLILTARDSLEARIGGLNGGADDYLVKPFALAELEARIRAVLRRPGARGQENRRLGDLAFNSATRTATFGGAILDLTRRESAVLEELLLANGEIVVKDRLEDRLYGSDGTVSLNAVEAAVSRLRRKLAAVSPSVQIDAIRGVGYRLKSLPCS